jgi:putative ABC transport system permease protein
MILPIRALLPWRNLTHSRRRFFVAVAGIAFAVLLMFMQLGFWNALMDSVVAVIDRFDAELVIISRARYSLIVGEPFPRRRLAQALSVPGVRDANPLYLEYIRSLWKNPDETDPTAPRCRAIRVLAFDTGKPLLRLPGVAENAARLEEPDTALVDVRSRSYYGRREAGIDREIAGHSVHVVGTFSLGTDFAANGNVIMNERTYARLFPGWGGPNAALSNVAIGLVQLEPGADPVAVKEALQQALPDDVRVFTRAAFAGQEKSYWQRSTPIGFFFLVGLVIGFAVGVAICYQILSADVTRHLPEYATLKAIGYQNRSLTGVVLEEAMLLSVLGFFPGLAVSVCLYAILAHPSVTGLPMRMTLGSATVIFGLTVGMCFLSGLLAIRKVQTADPAEVF